MEFQQDAMSAAKPAIFMEDDTEGPSRSINPSGDRLEQPTRRNIEEPFEESGEQRQNRIVASRLSILDEHILCDDSGELFASNPASDVDRHSPVASASMSEEEEQDEHHEERKQPAKPGAMSVSGTDAANALYARKDRANEKVSAEIVRNARSDGEDQGKMPPNTQMDQSQLSTKARAANPGALFVSDADSKKSSSAYSGKVARGKNNGFIYQEDREAAKIAAMQRADNVEDRMVQARMSILGEHILEGSESTSDPIRPDIVAPDYQWNVSAVPGQREEENDNDGAPSSLSSKMEAREKSDGGWKMREARPISGPPTYPSNEGEMTFNGASAESEEYLQSGGDGAISGEATFIQTAGVVVPEPKSPQEMAPPLKKHDLESGFVEPSEELITAKPVDEEDFEVKLEKEMEDRIKNQTVMALAIAEEHDDVEGEIPKTLWRRYRLPCIGLFLVLVVVAIALGLTVGGDSGPSQRLSPTNSPTAAPTFSDEHYLREILSLASSEADLLDPSTPQHQAMQWLINEDPADLPLREAKPERLRERYILAVLYNATGGPAWTDNTNFLSEKSVCEWAGVFCGNENSIVDLDFRKYMEFPSPYCSEQCVLLVLAIDPQVSHRQAIFVFLTTTQVITISTVLYHPR